MKLYLLLHFDKKNCRLLDSDVVQLDDDQAKEWFNTCGPDWYLRGGFDTKAELVKFKMEWLESRRREYVREMFKVLKNELAGINTGV